MKQVRRTSTGQFRKGVSGNPNGRPRRDAADPPAAALVPRPPTQATRHDGYTNAFTGHGTRRDRRTFTRFRGDIVTDDEALDLWETEFLAARIIEAMPEEGYRRGWKIKLKDEELAEELWNWADELGIEHAVVDAWEKENALGGSAIFPVIDGAQGDLSQPLDWGSISSISALHVLEPRELTPVAFHVDLRDPQWSHPSHYMFTPLSSGGMGSTFGSQVIHASRLVVFPGLRVSRQIRPGQRLGWGISRLSRPKAVLADFGLAWGSAATLLHEHGLGVLEMDQFAELMATVEGEEIVARRLSAMLMAKSTLRALVVDAKDKYTRQASSLSGLAEVLGEFKILMSAASDGMPVSVLMGQAQTGLRTGDDDVQTWYGNVEKRRSKRIRPRHTHLMKFLMLAGSGPTGGTEPEAWSIEYPSMWSPSDKEVADTRKTDMDRAVAGVEAGIVSADEVAESFYGSDQYSGDIRVNWERRKAQAAVDAEGAGDLSGEDRQALGEGDDEPSDDELDAMAADDEAADEDFPVDDDGEGRQDAAPAVGAGGHGYNPYRASDGKFGAGAHKAIEAHHRQESQRLAGEQKAIREQSKALVAAGHKNSSAAMVKLKKQHEALGEQRKVHQAAAAEAGKARKAAGHEGGHPTEHAVAEPHHAPPLASKSIEPAKPATAKAPEIPAEHRVSDAENAAARQKFDTLRAQYEKGGDLAVFHANYGEHFTPREDKRLPTPREYIAEQDIFSKSITRHQVFAFQQYEGSSFEAMNNHLRGKPSHIRDDEKESIAEMHAALSAHARASDLVSFRGAAVTADHPLAHLKPGSSFVDKAFTSSTIFPGHAEGFTQGSDKAIHFVITSPKGTHVAPMAALHANAREGEFVHDTNTRFTVTHREDLGDGGIRYHVQADSQ